jgi:GNAT superfamily N-acetyltransferase
MIFRLAKPADATPISDLIMSFRHLLTVDPDGSGAGEFFASVSAEAERKYISSDRYCFVVAEAGGKLVGFIAMRDRTHLFHLFVAPEYQRRGLARELWRQGCEATGPHRAGTEFTVNSSLPAMPVYERFGFHQAAPPVHQSGVAFVPMKYRDDGTPTKPSGLEEIRKRSASERELVVDHADAIEVLCLCEEHSIPVLGWEGWLEYGDGRLGHSQQHQGTADLSELPRNSALELCRTTIERSHAEWRQKPEDANARLLFCIAIGSPGSAGNAD